MKKTSLFALLLSLILHFIIATALYLLYQATLKQSKSPQKKEKRVKISLKKIPQKKLLTSKKKVNKKKKTTPLKPLTKAPSMPKGEQLKKLTKKLINYKKKSKKKSIKKKRDTKRTKKSTLMKKAKRKKITPKKSLIKLPQKKDLILHKKKPLAPSPSPVKKKKLSEENTSLYSILSQKKVILKTQESKIQKSTLSNSIKSHYGSKFAELSEYEQKYLLSNEEIMFRITQEVFTRVARLNLPQNFNADGFNYIEFYLHPNGDMSDFKFLTQSKYYLLNDTTKETMLYAYSRYPHPEKKVLIRYKFRYYYKIY